jgi:succinyl-CoA synthetase beta subunit
MMLYEYQAKDILRKYGIPVPEGYVVSAPADLKPLVRPRILKAQVHSGGRGKSGGVLKAGNDEDARSALDRLLLTTINDLPVRRVLVEELLTIDREFYLSLALDRDRACTVLMVSGQGGMDIEEVAQGASFYRLYIHPLLGLQEYQIREVTFRLGLEKKLASAFGQVIRKINELYHTLDATLVEINPLGLCGGEFIAADCKIVIDGNALFRHPELAKLAEAADDDPLEQKAHREGLAYVHLGGSIGIMGNGAGLVMGTIDTITSEGGKAANFLDVGGGARAETVKKALEIVLSDPAVKGVFINIFGGITRCDEVASGIVQIIREVGIAVPLVIKLVGTHADEGRAILEEAHLNPVTTMKEGARKIVELVKETA